LVDRSQRGQPLEARFCHPVIIPVLLPHRVANAVVVVIFKRLFQELVVKAQEEWAAEDSPSLEVLR